MLCLLLCAILSIDANANDYYFSSSSGSDANSGTENSPWQTLNKLNSLSLQSGDHVFLKRGDVFYGSINLIKSGSSGSPIFLDAYGSGNKPVITGLSDATGWTYIGNNIWESSALVNGQSSTMIVTVNGVSVPMGKWPNGTSSSGWRTYNSFSGNSSITDANALPSSPGWTGATIVIRKNQYTIQKGTVTSQSGNTLGYTAASSQTVNPTNGYGYFIQNHIGTLDVQNEWYYNSSTKKLDIYSTYTPTNVKMATITSVVDLTNRSFITFSNIVFQGSNYDLITANAASNITFANCDLRFAGNTAFWTNTINNLNFQNCTVSDNNNMGIVIGSTSSSGNVISNNTITNTGRYAGMTTQDTHTNIESCNGVLAFGGLTFTNNIVKNSGYSAIQFKGSNVLIQNNFIDSTCITKDEGASIYSYVGASDYTNYTNQKIDGNIVTNAAGALAGKPSAIGDAKGIYMDINVRNVNITNNSIANCTTYGILLQDNQNDLIRGNTVYNCGNAALAMWSDNLGVVPLNTVVIRQNTFVMRNPNLNFGTIYYQNRGTSFTDFGSSDSNVIATPLNDVNAWFTSSAQSTFNHFTLPQWQTTTPHDIHSKKSSQAVSDIKYLRFEYNASSINKAIALGATYIDITGKTYSGSITLAPYTSAVLIYVSGTIANQPPVANAGTDQNFSLPTDSTKLTGNGTDTDGTITAYQWSKISGPDQYSIVSPSSAKTSLNNLVEGNYQFELIVTDNAGAISKDTIGIIVNAANEAPVVNAGPDVNVTLPTNSVTISGSGNDPDGTVISSQWTKVSGPSQYSIVSPTQTKTAISNLAQGIYSFELKVTDNSGAVNRDTTLIIVNAAPVNQSPTASAGLDINITLPNNTATLSGTGSDPDGSIASYQWTKIAGPSQYLIVAPNQAQTTVNNLIQGIYKFEFKITDNSGAIDRDTIQVTVNAAINQAPLANAGANIIITLPTNSTTLAGSGTDIDGTIASYQWTKISGPSQYIIGSPTLAKTTIKNLIAGTYEFELKVTDNQGANGRDTVKIIVNTAPSLPNQSPTVNAGPDVNVTLPTNSVKLSGNATDADGKIVSYRWNGISGPKQFTITYPTRISTTISNLVQGIYNFELTVTDDSGAIDRDTVQVTVNAAISSTNKKPKANAGADKNVTLPTNTIALTGAATDEDGTISAYQWAEISGPSSNTVISPSTAQTSISNLVEGVYQFELTVTDNLGALAKDTIKVTVYAAAPPNKIPTANAGLDINITLPTSSVILNGSGSDADGSIVSYQWTKILGPASYVIVSSIKAQTTVNDLVQGIYRFELKITDNAGAVDKDTVQITVNAAPANKVPVANAGGDLGVTLPTDSATLSGKGVDADGTITSYQWKKIDGPASYSIISSTKAQTRIKNLKEGVYQFELTVTDNAGATAKDVVKITVNAAIPSNQLPIANAGSDLRITLPTDSTILSGKGADADGNIVSYQWAKISGPAQFTIASSGDAKTSLRNLTEGIYQFELTVTDNSGASSKDTIEVMVTGDTKSSAKVFPNPATDIINIKINAVTGTSNTSLRIYNNQGNLVYEEDFIRPQQSMIKQVNVSKLQRGIYFAELQTDTNNIINLRFIKM